MTPHNPHKLTAEQVGVADGWRLLDRDEVISEPHDLPPSLSGIDAWVDGGGYWFSCALGHCGSSLGVTYRTKLTRAELRAARGLPPETTGDLPIATDSVVDPYAVRIGGELADPYRIALAYGLDAVLGQALKKILRCGRKHKTPTQDVEEAISTLQRWKELHK